MLLNKIYNKNIKRTFVGFIVAVMLLAQSPYSFALAQTAPSAPSAPTAPTAPEELATTVEESTPPTAPDAPTTASDEPTAPSDPSTWEDEEGADSNDQNSTNDNEEDTDDNESTENETQNEPAVLASDIIENETGGQDDGGNVGDTTIDTGDADINGAIVTDANTNISTSEDASGEGIEIVNSENGNDSQNSGSVVISDTDNTTQTNTAQVTNDMGLGAVTGDNESSKNVGNTTINTGDANTTGTIVNSLNTNVDGIMVSEFNIVEDHLGDYLLDFSSGCISGCDGGVAVNNQGNGSSSENNAEVDINGTDNTFQTNDATITNNMVLYSDSGNNEADKNTAGDSTINTGDANVNANILNFANNNLAGDIIYAVVNIFGDLIGDIIFPDGSLLSLPGSTSVSNTGNGSESVNTGEVMQNNTDNIAQFNTADIDNNLIIDANTGDNETSDNTGGTNSITTGDADVLAQIVNVANMNLVGGNWWLVIVNEAGNWVGKILGSPDGSNMAASEGIDLVVNDLGDVSVINSGNGSDSVNTASVSQENTDNITQNNNAKIVNNVDLSANTGKNSASKNTGGDSTIKTGDVNVVANIVNFVNNNIVGTGKLFVTMVNVFGNWFGDFVGPGYEKQAELQDNTGAIGGTGSSNTNNYPQGSSSDTGSSESGTGSGGGSTETETSTSENVFAASLKTKAVLSYSTDSGSANSASVNSDSEADTRVLASESENTAGEKVINVNLAWLTLLIPFAGIILIIKKRFMYKFLPTSKGNV